MIGHVVMMVTFLFSVSKAIGSLQTGTSITSENFRAFSQLLKRKIGNTISRETTRLLPAIYLHCLIVLGRMNAYISSVKRMKNGYYARDKIKLLNFLDGYVIGVKTTIYGKQKYTGWNGSSLHVCTRVEAKPAFMNSIFYEPSRKILVQVQSATGTDFVYYISGSQIFRLTNH
jgi:hypothetical protein